ncbi:hypothetical protein JOD64_004291 [Micromonospora luteifusca]|uniref:Uncharacterized protein n=1 Tax=Micromonospora luteifusca TaxID=709860 RepID=A0ABS2LZK2_9ACTN|nr:hypothetical protein [Micromonospora luteifusca]MBM7493069.1 hypothetical protein [Micromonospora luteifusca]
MEHTSPNEPTPTDPVEPPPAAVAQVNPVQLPEWMRSSQTEHQPTGWDRVRFFSARHNGALLVGLGLVLALLMVVGGVVLVGRITGGGGASASASPTASPTPPLSRVGEPRDLFAGSPAASFAPAEEAVRMPAAKGTGPFTETQVRTALESVRKALVESRIDISMFMGDPEPFLALLAPDTREQIRADFSNNSFLRYATRMASPSEWEPGARADGRISYRATKANGIRVLEVSTEFVWAYPFDVDLRAPAGASVVALRDRVVWQVPHPDDVPASARGLWITSADAVTWNADCDALRDGWVHEQFWVADVHRDRIPAGDPGTIFDLEAPAPTTTRC